jgi:hypothetical protein
MQKAVKNPPVCSARPNCMNITRAFSIFNKSCNFVSKISWMDSTYYTRRQSLASNAPREIWIVDVPNTSKKRRHASQIVQFLLLSWIYLWTRGLHRPHRSKFSLENVASRPVDVCSYSWTPYLYKPTEDRKAIESVYYQNLHHHYQRHAERCE